MELKSNFNPLTAMAAHENTILAAPVLPKGMPAPFDHAWGYLDKPGEMERHRHPKRRSTFSSRAKASSSLTEKKSP